MSEKTSVYGYCPICGSPSNSRERRPFGDDTCENGHKYPSAEATGKPKRKGKRK